MLTGPAWVVVLEGPHAGFVRIDVVPCGEDAARYTFRLVSSLPDPPELDDVARSYATPEAARDGAVALLRAHCAVRAVYPQGGPGLREAVGRAWAGLEAGADAQVHLKVVVRWILEGLRRAMPGLVARGLVAAADEGSVYEALRHFALVDVVGFPSDFAPDAWLDRLPTPLLVELAHARGALAELYKAEALRRAGVITRWEFVRLGPYAARVDVALVAPVEHIVLNVDVAPPGDPKEPN